VKENQEATNRMWKWHLITAWICIQYPQMNFG